MTKKIIHVAFFSHDANLKGGGSISLLNLLDNLPHVVKCFVFLPGRGEFSHELDQRNIAYAILPDEWWVNYDYQFDEGNLYRSTKSHLIYYHKAFQKVYKNLKALPEYIKLINKHKVDVIYTNTSVIFMGALLSILLRKPHIWHIREYKSADFRFDFGSALFNFFLQRAKAKIFVSEALRKKYPKFACQASSFVVYNGIPAPKRGNYTKEEGWFTFSMVGKLTESKGQEIAIEALSYLKKNISNVRLVLAGKGKDNYTAYLKEMCRKLEVDKNVVFLGSINDPYKVYYASDVYLMCSSNETFGRVTVEAMLANLPVIGYASESTGTKEIVINGETGLLYEGSAEELSVCMEKIIANPALLLKLGKNAHQRAICTFGVDMYAKKIESIIQYATS